MTAPKISAFVITCDRDPVILRATLSAVRWVDDLVLVDKGDRSMEDVARQMGARYHPAARSPVVEDTRGYAASLCEHDWLICLDDDEILSPGCERACREFVAEPIGDGISLPIRHYVLGRHDPTAWYSPEWHPTLFRRDGVRFLPTVHGGMEFLTNAGFVIPNDCWIDHLSHPDIATWLEKTNRYTDQRDRIGVACKWPTIGWACNLIARRAADKRDPYRDAVAVLRGVYDIIDGLKRWEETQPNGHEAFYRIAMDVIQRNR